MKKMGERTTVLRIAVCVFVCMLLAGCGPMSQVRRAAMASKDEKSEAAGEEENKGQEKAETAGKEEPEAEAKAPVLGEEGIGDYEEFQYLYKAVLTAYMDEDIKSGKIKRKNVTVYIPKGSDSGINKDLPGTAYSDTQGVSFFINVNPYYLEADPQKGRTMQGELQGYISHIYDNADRDAYEDLEVSDIRNISEDAAAATIKYCWYDSEEYVYSVFYKTYYLRELEPGLQIMLEVEIDSGKATAETEELLEELEAFYEVDIEWDSVGAEKKLTDYLAEKKERILSSLGTDFRFPENWEVDEIYSDDEIAIYAPGGDSDGAGCGIGIACVQEEDYWDDPQELSGGEEYLEVFLSGVLGDVEGLEIGYYGNTCIGETTLAEFTYISDEEEKVDCNFYLGWKEGNMYFVVAMQYQWLEMNTFELAEELLKSGVTEEEA